MYNQGGPQLSPALTGIMRKSRVSREAALLLQDAGNRFWALVMAEGVEDWVRR